MTLYDGTTDPLDYVNQYKQNMMVVTATGSLKEACMCKGFGSTLSGVVLQWFVCLPNKSISTFVDLVNVFNQQFANSRKPEKQTSDLYKMVQRFEESTRDYLNRFNREKVFIPKCDIPTAVEAFRRGLHHDLDLYRELTNYPCTTFEELSEYGFTTELAGVLKALKEVEQRVRWPKKPVPRENDRRDASKRCEYHHDIGHNTEDCVVLCKEIKHLHEAGCLDHLLPKGAKSGKVNTAEQVLLSSPPLYSKVVNVITGGLEICGLTYSAAKRRTTETKGDKPESSCRNPEKHGIQRETLAEEGGAPGRVQRGNKALYGRDLNPTFALGVNKQVRYLVIDGPSTYNVIFGRPCIHEMKAVPSAYHWSPKYPTPWGVQEIRGDQEEARYCYKDVLKPTASPPT
ncbi:uncharacterized protein LOC141587555 [Silene latifolia]|uniref:uncharacterized protein LOC141587555 n=1 Tax=Silene latifolia TaxID=37657 RepID=UPI003D786F0D